MSGYNPAVDGARETACASEATRARNVLNSNSPATSFLILGLTQEGRRFRPSDWTDRLCGVMSSYRPKGMPQDRLSYSPYVMPTMHEGAKCVRVDARIHGLEPMAYHFLRGFAHDNALQVVEVAAAKPSPMAQDAGQAGDKTDDGVRAAPVADDRIYVKSPA
ncbi:MAG: DUF3579 domain-containing protein [Burkholderiaceae bacterium]|nr:DUF3579 domain-containing protein [Burkholderiaceae bacterium]